MKERPIPFSAPMVRALLDGRKTQTRRIAALPMEDLFVGFEQIAGQLHAIFRHGDLRSPYGQPGDRLWVREHWRLPKSQDKWSGSDVGDMCLAAGYSKPWASIEYLADGRRENWHGVVNRDDPPGRFRQARFMPRWASRITLGITDVRVQRLQDISEADAAAEGIDYEPNGGELYRPWRGHRVWWEEPKRAFRDLWASINGVNAWTDNPWVWVLTFRRLP